MAGISRQAARTGYTPKKKVAATAGILRQILAPIPGALRGLRDRALLLVGFTWALGPSEVAAIRTEQLEKTERGLRLSLLQTKGPQTDAVIVALHYGHTELCPVRAVTAWLDAADSTTGPVFRCIWLPKKPPPGEPPPLPARLAAHHPLGGCRDRQGTRRVGRVHRTGLWRAQPEARGGLTTGRDRGEHPARLRRLGRHKGFYVLGGYLESGDLFEGHPLKRVL